MSEINKMLKKLKDLNVPEGCEIQTDEKGNIVLSCKTEHTHLCVDEIADNIRSNLDEIEKTWDTLQLGCNAFGISDDLKKAKEITNEIVLKLRDVLYNDILYKLKEFK